MNIVSSTSDVCINHKHGICWSSILAGALAAGAASFALFVLASSYGLAIASPWSGEGLSAKAVGINAFIAIIIIQWMSSALGGYMTGRLRSRWAIVPEEVAFRDMAHGFLTWALATLVTVVLLGSAVTMVVGGGVKGIAAGSMIHAADDNGNGTSDSMAYYVDSLFRTETPVATTSGEDNRAEVTRILAKGATDKEMSEDDKNYLAGIIARRTGITVDEANARIDNTITEVKKATDTARKATATLALFTFLSFLIGAFIAAVAAVLGGRYRDDVRVVV